MQGDTVFDAPNGLQTSIARSNMLERQAAFSRGSRGRGTEPTQAADERAGLRRWLIKNRIDPFTQGRHEHEHMTHRPPPQQAMITSRGKLESIADMFQMLNGRLDSLEVATTDMRVITASHGQSRNTLTQQIYRIAKNGGHAFELKAVCCRVNGLEEQ